MLRFTPAQQDYILQNRRSFNAQQAVIANMLGENNGQALVGNALPLPRDVWGEWDRDAVMIQRDILAVFNDLASSVSFPMPIGKLVHYFQTVSDSGEVNISMDGRSKAREDQPVFDYHGTPLPIVDSTYSFGWRQMEAARTEGVALDPTARDNSNRKVAEKMEDIALNGDAKIVVGGAQLYGLRNHPKRNTRSTGVTLNGATGVQWKAEIIALVKLMHTKNFRVPMTIYMNWDDWFYADSTDYNTTQNFGKTILQAIKEIEGVGQIIPGSKVPANELIAVVKNRSVVQVLNGMPLSNRAQFRANPEDDYDFVAMMAAAVEIKYDAIDQCGIGHSS